VHWIVLVRVTYHTGSEYNFLEKETFLRMRKNIGSWKILLHVVIWFIYYYTSKHVLLSSSK